MRPKSVRNSIAKLGVFSDKQLMLSVAFRRKIDFFRLLMAAETFHHADDSVCKMLHEMNKTPA